MDVGFLLRGMYRVDPAVIRDLAQGAEAVGCASIWANEHVAVPGRFDSRFPYSPDGKAPLRVDSPLSDAIATLAYVSGLTSRIRVGTSVIPMTTRGPVTLAKQAACVDLLSGGRLDLGIGTGWLLEEAALLGMPANRRLARMAESIDIMRLAWGSPRFSYNGELYTIPEAGTNPLPPQGNSIPLWIGGASERIVRLASEKHAGVILSGDVPSTPELVRRIRELAEANGSAGLRIIATVNIDAHGSEHAVAELAAAGAAVVMASSRAPAQHVLARLAEFMEEALVRDAPDSGSAAVNGGVRG